jgi:hypothetical protein
LALTWAKERLDVAFEHKETGPLSYHTANRCVIWSSHCDNVDFLLKEGYKEWQYDDVSYTLDNLLYLYLP